MDLSKQKLYTIGEAARILGVSITTLRRWDREGKISVGRTPSGNRVFSEFDILVLKKTLRPKSEAPDAPKFQKPSFFNFKFISVTLIILLLGLNVLNYTGQGTKAVLGVESFIAPVAAEVSPILAPIGRLFSQVGSFFQTRASLFLIALLDNTPEGVVSLSSFTLSDLKVNNLSLGSTSGTTTINNNLNVVGDTTLGNLYVSGSLDVSYPTILTTLSVVNNATFASTLQVSGPVSFESTVNGNTFTNNSLVFSGVSPSISASTSNSTISLNAGTTGAINIGNSSTGDIHLGGGSASSGCSVTNDNGSFNCSSNITSGGDLIANGGDILTNQTTFNLLTQTVTTLNIGSSSSTINLQGTASFTKAPTLAHTGTWAINSSTWNQSNATVYINPATATADSNLLGIAVNGGVKFAVDAEGDIYGNNLVVAGNTTTATTTVSGDLTVEGNTTLGDATTDTFTINPATITLAGGNKTLDITGAATRTLTLLNSTTSQVADLDLSDGSLKLNGTTRISNAGAGTLDNLTVNPTSSSQVAQVIKGATSQSVDLLQFKTSLDAIIAKVDQLGNITGRTLESTVTTGTAPLTVASTTMVTNLNANYLGGSAAADLGYSTNPNLVLNSDFSRRNKWMTFMPEVFSDTSGYQQIDAGTAPTVVSNTLTFGAANNQIGYPKVGAGTGWWRDIRASAQVKAVSTTGVFNLRIRYVDNNNFVEVRTTGASPNRVELSRTIAGVRTVVNSVQPAAITLNNWYWLEIEAQGTTFIVKWYSSGASPVAKSSATLLETLSGTVSDSAVAVGGMTITSDQSTAAWGGLSTGDGGVYVEGWGPESIASVTWTGTVGGQAWGFDEAADSGPIGKQWALRAYTPATNRGFYFQSADGPDGGIASSATYAFSTYMKVSDKGGSGALGQITLREANSNFGNAADTNLNDSSETSWTRKTSTLTTASTTRRFRTFITVNPSNTASGTVYFDLPQLEQGATITPWRNAPADDGPITWFRNIFGPAITPTYSLAANAAWQEINPKQAAANIFVPWDATIEVTFEAAATNDGFEVQLRPTIDGAGTTADFSKVIGLTKEPIFLLPLSGGDGNFDDLSHRVSAGKHRVAVEQKHTSGTLTLYSDPRGVFQVRATRGKFDLAEEYSVVDQSIEGGDVVRLSGVGGTTVEKTVGGYSQDILGIISTAPGITLSSQVELNGYREKPNLRPVALSGRVPVKVTNENGPIKRGDILTSSATIPGYAMKATKAGRSIGIAMEDLPVGVNEGKILTFVNLSFYDPDVYLTDQGQLVISNTTNTTNTTNNSITLGDNGLIQTQTPKYQLTNIQTKEIIERTGGYNNLFVANLKVGSLDVSEINSDLIKNLELRIKNLEIGTGSAVLSASASALIDYGLQTTAVDGSQSTLDSLTVLGKILVNDLGITGRITAGLLSIDGLEGSITSLTDIKLKTQSGQITIDKNGNLKVQNSVTAKKYYVDSADLDSSSLGGGLIPAGATSVTIPTTAVTDKSRIFVTAKTKTGKQGLIVTETPSIGFIVSIEEPYSSDISFNWWIVDNK